MIFGMNGVSSAHVQHNYKVNKQNLDPSNIYVNTNTGNDSWNGLAPSFDGVNGPKKSIKNASGTVNTNGNIKIANGYYSGIDNSGIIIHRNMSFIGQSQTKTVISGSKTARIFEVINGSTVSFYNLTLTQGSGGNYRGGALRISADGEAAKPANWINPTVYIENCTFKENSEYNGACIGNYGDLTIKHCQFLNNKGTNGAAIYSGSRFVNYHIYVKIYDCSFINNQLTTTMNGGAIFNNDNSNMYITRCLFTGNIGNNGGAINNNAMGNMTVTHCVFKNNTGQWGADIVFYSNKYNQAYSIANYNKFLSNGSKGSVHAGEDAPSDLRWNWWGTNQDPFKTGKITVGLQNSQGMMIYDPWVVLTVHTNKTNIQNSNNTTITADLNHLSDGSLVQEALPDGQITLNIPWGSFNKTNIKHTADLVTVNGTASATFFANEGPVNPLYNPVQITATAEGYTTNTEESAHVTINKSIDVALIIAANQAKTKVNETVKLVYKMVNGGPDPANVVVTIPLPANFQVANIKGDGSWNYNKQTHTITWIHANLTTNQYLYITGTFKNPGTYNLNANITTEINNLNTQGVTPLTIQATNKKANINMAINNNTIHPKVNESVNLTYKLTNKGPDSADSVVVTMPLPKGFNVSMITGDGSWNYNPKTNTIIWTFANLEQAVKYLYVTGTFTKPGTYNLNANLTTDTYNLNTQGVTPLILHAYMEPLPPNFGNNTNKSTSNPKNNTMKTCPITNKTGTPIAILILAVIMVLGGSILSKKQ
jgi:uncharacterized repeat protein (TIGR01451 family)